MDKQNDWDARLAKIVQDTENSLSRVRERLGSARIESRSALGYSAADSAFRPVSAQLSQVSVDEYIRMPDNFETKGYGRNSSNLDQSNGVATLLYEKLEGQNREISELRRIVGRLENEKDNYRRDMDDLRDEMSKLNRRFSERGVDLVTERKVEQWKRELETEVSSIQHRLKLQNGKKDNEPSIDYTQNSQIQFITRELSDLKKYSREEVDTLRREFETFKSRLVRIELEVAATSTENKDLFRRHDRLDRSIRDLSNASREHTGRKIEEREREKMTLEELKDSMKILKDKLSSVENTVTSKNKKECVSLFNGHSNRTNYNGQTESKKNGFSLVGKGLFDFDDDDDEDESLCTELLDTELTKSSSRQKDEFKRLDSDIFDDDDDDAGEDDESINLDEDISLTSELFLNDTSKVKY